jgi:hypothetical protein
MQTFYERPQTLPDHYADSGQISTPHYLQDALQGIHRAIFFAATSRVIANIVARSFRVNVNNFNIVGGVQPPCTYLYLTQVFAWYTARTSQDWREVRQCAPSSCRDKARA